MKKRMTVLFSLFLALILTGCGQGGETTGKEGAMPPMVSATPEITEKPEITEEPEITHAVEVTGVLPTQSVQAEVPLSESEQALVEFQKEIRAEGSLCAVAYLGYQSGDFTEFYGWLEATEFLTENPFLEEVTEEGTVLAAGGEWYAVVPADNSSTLTVNETVFDETDYSLKAGKELLQVSDGGPVLLRGNVSDIMPNLMVTVTNSRGETLKYCPALSLKDGHLQSAEGIYDFTVYNWFMEPETEYESVATIQIYKASNSLEQWGDGVVRSSGSRVTLRLGEEDAALYPELAEELAAKAKEDLDTLKYNVEKLKQWAEGDNAEGYYDDGMVTVQRADEKVFSIRRKFYEYSGGMHPNNYTTGWNLDPESGGRYALEDMISDMTVLLPMIEERLFEKYPADTFFWEKGKVLEDYAIDNLAWTLGYQGITFYFSPYEIAPYVAGTLTATIWFDEAPGLFYEEYTYAPEQGYTISFFTGEELEFDQNLSDDRRDVLCVYKETTGSEEYETITIRYNEEIYQEKVYTVQKMIPYLVCSRTPGGENYSLCLELQKDGEIVFYVYDLNGEKITRTEVLQDMARDGFWATEAGEEVYYEELLPPFGY